MFFVSLRCSDGTFTENVVSESAFYQLPGLVTLGSLGLLR